MKEYKIYVLKNPETHVVKYVGVTTRSLNQRLYQHLSEARNKTGTYKINWIRSLLKNNKKPIIDLLEICNETNWEEREKYWINFYPNLTNTDIGGKGIIFKNNVSIKKSSDKHCKKIVQLDLNLNYIKTYNSIREASKELNILYSSISNVLNNRVKSALGYHFVYLNKYTDNYKIDLKSTIIRTKRLNIKITFNDDSYIILNNIKKASKYLNVSSSLISMVLKGVRNFSKMRNIKKIQQIKI